MMLHNMLDVAKVLIFSYPGNFWWVNRCEGVSRESVNAEMSSVGVTEHNRCQNK